MSRFVFVLACFVVCFSVVFLAPIVTFASDPEWILKSPLISPPPRDGGAIAYDSARQRTILFGGYSNGIILGDTWEWDGNTWVQRFTIPSPLPRNVPGMAYDSARGVVVLFGGTSSFTGGGFLGDTWEWDGTAWTLRATTGPSSRYAHSLVYDAARERTVLFGGYDGDYLGDTWEWDGTAWTLRATTGPESRAQSAATFDSTRQRTVLFGGWNEVSFFGDTWNWDGMTWTLRAIAGPPPRYGVAMAFDSMRRRAVLFGGFYDSWLGDTWEWDGMTWTEIPVSDPGARYHHAMTYDDARGAIVLFGGERGGPSLGDTWLYDNGIVMFTTIHQPRVSWQSHIQYSSYNLYRGSLEALRVGGPYTQVPGSNPYAERFCGLAETYMDDFFIPLEGEGFYWLVVGVGPGGEEPLGDGDTVTRPNDNPCP